MRIVVYNLVGFFCLIILLGLTSPSTTSPGIDTTLRYFKEKSTRFASSAEALRLAIALIDRKRPETVIQARNSLKECRLNYKRIEFFIEYFFKSNAVFYNGPPKFEIEEPYMEWQTPIGLQVIESLLFEEDIYAKKKELIEQAEALSSSAEDIQSILYGFRPSDKQILESIRLELVRIYSLGITGFDAPLLKSGIQEAVASIEALQYSLTPFLQPKTEYADSVAKYLKTSLQTLQASKSFDSFDRLTFLKAHGLPLQKHLSLLIKEMHLELNTTRNILNYDADNMFSADAINVNAFPGANTTDNLPLIELGKKLFKETGLSGNNRISCATCHQPQKHFTDGLAKSIAFNGHSSLKRNASSLLYSGFQYEQFWDGRAKSLEEQVKTVLSNHDEMNCDPVPTINRLVNDENYTRLFSNSFPGNKDSIVTIDKIAASIAAFVRTLNPRNSAFDKYMQGDETAITLAQMRGFNLFMGKAQCGTCHFAPLFNGLVPPLYDLTEVEVLGTPKTDILSKPHQDDDMGRFRAFPIHFYERAFKTPTVRNVSATAPYMHNGSFKTLEKVVEFYNKGGGKGIGLKVPNQTLSSSPLNLTTTEIKDIVNFMHSLQDVVTE